MFASWMQSRRRPHRNVTARLLPARILNRCGGTREPRSSRVSVGDKVFVPRRIMPHVIALSDSKTGKWSGMWNPANTPRATVSRCRPLLN